MSKFIAIALCLAVVAGCGKKPITAPPPPGKKEPAGQSN
jgi:hypothetical protein